MKFAFVDGQRQETQPGLVGTCPGCEGAVYAKCGKVRVWHWYHKSKQDCDKWWENEGPWHRAWKAEFPDAWQEVVQVSASGERHIADIKTDHGWVIELQHSPISPEERRSRDAFYRQVVWVVDGTERKRDAAQFVRAWNAGTAVGTGYPVRRLFADDCRLLREWTATEMPILIDFGDMQWLWWVLPGRQHGAVYVAAFQRAQFVHILRTGVAQEGLDFGGLVREFGGLIARYEASVGR